MRFFGLRNLVDKLYLHSYLHLDDRLQGFGLTRVLLQLVSSVKLLKIKVESGNTANVTFVHFGNVPIQNHF